MVPRVKLLVAILMLTAVQPVMAQGMQAGSMQSMTPSSAIGPDQDSLLPPEVVPIDPNAVSQVQSRQAGMPAGQTNPMEMRRQALGQLLGDQTTIPPAAMKPWRAGQTATQMPGNLSSVPGMPQVTGMPQAALSNQTTQLGAPNYQMANNQNYSGSQGFNAPSQTLTGSSQNQPQQINTRRGGFSNIFSSAATMGLGAIASPLRSGYMMAAPFARF